MCFSATASFGAATALAGIGVLSLRRSPSRTHAPLAAIPIVFAAQQACEGSLWLVLADAPFGRSDTSLVRAFLFFALLVWPVYVPIAFGLVEPSRVRSAALAAMAACGAGLGVYLMGCATFRASDACIAFGNLYYFIQVDASLKGVVPFLYVGVVVASLAVSSLRGAKLLAAVVVASFALTGVATRAGFISVWCFVMALLSGIVTLVVRGAARAPRGAALPVYSPKRDGGDAPPELPASPLS